MALIIYAEDDDIIGELVQHVLIDAGHALGVVGDGKEVLAVLARRKPDLLILDIGLPSMTGSDVLETIRRHPELYDLPVLMLTARQGAGDEAIARFSGASDYLRKPFQPEELVYRVNRLLGDKAKPR